jgi:hypothetical protein
MIDNNEGLSQQTVSMDRLFINGREPQNWKEMEEVLSGIDLVDSLKNTKLVDNLFSDTKILSFNNKENSRTFIMALGVEGAKKGMFDFSPVSYFEEGFLTEHRIDTGQFFVYERKDRVEKERVNTMIGIRYSDDEKVEKYSGLIRDVISSTMPHLAGEVKNLKLGSGAFSL